MADRTIGALRGRHHAEECRLVLDALIGSDWSITTAAARLAIAVSTLQSMIERLGLSSAYAEHAPGRVGRPPKAS